VHATCACLALSAHRAGEIWASTDDGLVHVTRDDGATWTNVTPRARSARMPELAYVGCVEISSHDADTVYVSATGYKQADYRPYLFRTRDSGKTWQAINGDLPEGEITRVIRADPVRPGLLFVGTETGIFYTRDDGRHWQRMPGGLPVTPVYDLKLKGSDLVAATHGRSFWVLDDIGPLRELQAGRGTLQLVTPRDTVRTRLSWSAGSGFAKKGVSYGPAFGIGGGTETMVGPDGRPARRFLEVGENPPNGALVYYQLPTGFKGPVKLSFLDEAGHAVNVLASDDPALPPGKKPGTQPGLNRYVWDLRHRGPVKLDPALMTRRNKPLADDPEDIPGPAVVPGRYRVVLEAASQRLEAGFAVVKDPRVKTPQRAFEQQGTLLRQLYGRWSSLNAGVNRIRLLKRQLHELARRLGPGDQALAERCPTMVQALQAIEAVLVDVHRESSRDVLRHRAGLNDTLSDLISVVAIADEPPTQQAREVAQEAMARVDGELARLDALVAGEIAALDLALRQARIEVVGPARA
jgi:predicted kinase